LNNRSIALIGNPNVGKTVIFNALTGSKAHVANWPGVTVEKKSGNMGEIQITDLPGVYSLTPTAIDDLIARNYIIDEEPNLIVDILDATNLERNLYLGLLLKEIGVPIIFVLNMMDSAKEKKIQIDLEKISEFLKSPVIPTSAIKEEGLEHLKEIIRTKIKEDSIESEVILYPHEIENKIKEIQTIFTENFEMNARKSRWYAIKLLENDKDVEKKISKLPNASQVLLKTEKYRDSEDIIRFAGARYSYIAQIISTSLKKGKDSFNGSSFLDKFFLDKVVGIPIFFIILWGMFEFTFRVATPFMTLIEVIQEYLGEVLLESMGESLWSSFLIDGIINGFGSIIIFLPNIFLMFLALSFLEDSGYLSRAAFVMDRLMYKLGLHGRSFVSMIIGFGCNVPAIMSTRAIESEKDRITTIMANQNMSCGARLPVYLMLGGAVWGKSAGSIIFSLYFLGIVVAVIVALTFQKILAKGERSPFILELGDYRSPTLKYTAIHMWEKGREFVKKAGTIIFVVVVVLWFLQTLPLDQSDPTESYLYKIGDFFQPLFGPLNFGTIAVIGIIFGFLAKEVVVAAFGLMLGINDESDELGGKIFADLGNNPVIAYSYLVFVLLYTPCVAVIGAIKRETGSWKWAWVSIIYGFILAYIMAFLVQLIGGVYF
jgi:ferrous iron transport protein B